MPISWQRGIWPESAVLFRVKPPFSVRSDLLKLALRKDVELLVVDDLTRRLLRPPDPQTPIDRSFAEIFHTRPYTNVSFTASVAAMRRTRADRPIKALFLG